MIWNNVNTIKPIATEKGCWDGLRSDKVLVCTRLKEFHVAIMYHTKENGIESFDFHDVDDYEIKNVRYWTEIDEPF